MVPLEWLRLCGMPEDIMASGNLNPIRKRSEAHLFDEMDFKEFLIKQKADVSLKGNRIEILLGDGNRISSRQCQVDSQLYLIKLQHLTNNSGVGISSERVILNLEGHFVNIPKNLLPFAHSNRHGD